MADHVDNIVEDHIRSLERRAKELVEESAEPNVNQNGKKSKLSIKTVVSNTNHYFFVLDNRKGNVTGGNQTNFLNTSQKSATLRSKMLAAGANAGNVQLDQDPFKPKRFYEEPSKKMEREEVKGTTWYDEYFALEEKIERMDDDNNKMKREISRRTERYIKNE